MSIFHTEATRREAVAARDRAADGAFVYAVTTTGVYCRPSCPARRAKPEHLRFFADPAAAARAGFRPCRRCRPDEPTASRHAAAIEAACRLIEAAETPPDLGAIAARAGLSRFHFHRVFKAATGLTPKAYAAGWRAKRVRAALAAGASVTEAIYDAGFGTSSRFYAEASRRLGMAPRAWRGGGAGARLRFALCATSLGAILVAASEQGIAAIELGDEREALLADFQARFPEAELIGGDADFARLVARVVALVEHPERAADLPLDIRGTAFQERVWRALQAIPPGMTVSYAALAERIGAKGAARAVAGACAANPLAVAIPCHRVVRSDGALSGYAWGVGRKRALLAREAAAKNKP
ncbi:MAG: bifunctional DNA-binding transcriptional regulator/O6-methylguanine-DNA methyltransferase Ada [Acidibrevibacterium sp.]|uniref:bifunctional DNA-binding transcriptional regulator/O6-methylguanine-DNA methyltransferase Ada n=1 Tax=Acidibrevibacterium sp. TaxID=2606776 RepID=UPI003CFD9A09